VFQRPNHLMSRAAQTSRVFFIEEPILDDRDQPPRLATHQSAEGVTVCVPRLTAGTDPQAQEQTVRKLVAQLVRDERVTAPWCWYYSPMMLPLAERLPASRIIYDCMDELSAFAGAPPELREREGELLRRADVVFTGGQSLYRAKRALHPRVHAFPSSVDAPHFARAGDAADPADQSALPRPRIGFFGVIDERLDVELVRSLAAARPSWQIVMLGPVVKIDPATLPTAPNLHWLGGKSYAELPSYLGGWDVAILPFALNEATRFISPTKTLEYLAAGKPVVSTAIADVADPYGRDGLVRIADQATFVRAIEEALREPFPAGREAVSETVARTSWDRTWARMCGLVQSSAGAERQQTSAGPRGGSVSPGPTAAGAGAEGSS
jgi:glycosyltransferase involved in cell wall biosynthesis